MADDLERDALEWMDGDMPFSTRFGDHFYAREDGRAETGHVFIGQNRLAERWGDGADMVIAELGFGTGLNFLETWRQWRLHRLPGARLDFVSFEALPMTADEIMTAIGRWPDLAPLCVRLVERWPDLTSTPVTWILDPQTRLTVVAGDALDGVTRWNGLADAYVATLFDQHAEDFDDILTGALGYAVPMQAAEWLKANRPGPYDRLLDLGCGTGLSGMMLMELCAHATGVDIAEQMVEKADERAAYDALYVNEAVHFLDEWAKSGDPDHQPFDLIVATDVLPYIGALEPLFDGIAANATADARLVVSAETLPALADGDKDWTVTPHQRFAHSADYLRTMCARAGFPDIELFEPITVRLEQGAPIPGFLVVAARP